MMPRHSIKQLKLTTGEEILCEVLDEAPESIAVRNALVLTDNVSANGDKYFTFRNFLVYQDGPMDVVLLVSDKIVAMAIPTQDMVTQYDIALEQMREQVELSKQYQEEEYGDDQTFEDFLREVDDYRLIDSDTDGFVKH
jgi:hypothetical protein